MMKKTKILYILIALLPFLDLITSIQSRNNITLTVGLVIKGIALLVALYYLIFRCQTKHKLFSLVLVFLIGLYVIGYFAFKPDLLNSAYLKLEISYIFKIIYMPIIFIALYNYFKEYGFNKKYFINAMKANLIFYTLLLLIPLCMKTAFNSYFYDYQGFVGWFYSANEISVITVLLLPFMYFMLDNKHGFNFLIALPIMYVMSSIGTKGALIGSVCVTVLAVIFMLILEKGKFTKKTLGTIGILIIMIFFFFVSNKLTIENVEKKVEVEQFEFIETPKTEKNKKVKREIKNENIKKLMKFLLNNRDLYYKQTLDIYDARYEDSYFLFGMGFSNTERIENPNIDKTIEIDYLDLYYHAGALAVVITLAPMIYSFVCVLVNLIKRKLNYIETSMAFLVSMLICLALSAAGLSGHVLYYPAVSFYVLLLCMYLLNYLHKFNKQPIKENKIQIYALHLNTGGIENVITNQANMLAPNYEVEIVSMYNSHKKIPFELSKKIKITYLMNTISNKYELKEAFKSFNVINIIKESFKAIKILINKNKLLRKAVINSDAKVIISSRSEFTKVITKYARDEVVTISEEHNYHNGNHKVISKVVSDNKNVDYLLPASKELTKFYSLVMNNRVKYIPNTIGNIPDKPNKLDNKKIISVGRLDKVKGYNDLIEIMSRVVKKDKEITLDIYGDGEERENLQTKIQQYHLEKNICLKGFINQKELSKKLNEYSLFACTSLSEAFGLAILEANSHGIPCIMFDDAKGPLEFTTNESGIIIKNRDLNKYSTEILKLFKNSKQLQKLGTNAYKIAKEYSYENCCKKLNEFMEYVMNNSKKIHTNVMFISSTGGHLNELLQLKSLFNTYDYEIVTEKTSTTGNLSKKYPNHVSYLAYGNKHSMIKYLFYIIPVNIFKSISYYFKYRPNFIITTGAHSAVFVCLFGKLFGSKIIYIETFANISTKTLSGKILYPFADKFIVQWDEMLKLYPDATIGGWIF